MMPTQATVAANFVMTVRLEAHQWNAVTAALGKAPYEVVASIIPAIHEQLQQQAVAASSNGLDLSGEGRAAA